jgi:hypothetical protein
MRVQEIMTPEPIAIGVPTSRPGRSRRAPWSSCSRRNRDGPSAGGPTSRRQERSFTGGFAQGTALADLDLCGDNMRKRRSSLLAVALASLTISFPTFALAERAIASSPLECASPG